METNINPLISLLNISKESENLLNFVKQTLENPAIPADQKAQIEKIMKEKDVENLIKQMKDKQNIVVDLIKNANNAK